MSEALAQVEILLSANTARFQESWENATQTVTDSTSTIRDRVLAMGQAISAAALAGVAALGAITMQQVELASNIQKSSSLAVVAAETFQYWSAGAKTVGVEQEKLGDILKDTNDKIGDFLANEGGEMQDFFNNIAPKVGVTAEQFRGLSGAEGLQLYYDTLVKANTGSAEMVFYMESIADEASALIPLLANGGEKLKYWGELAESTGYIMSDGLIAKAKELGEQTEIMAMRWQGFKNSISEITLPPLTNWLSELNKTGGVFENISKTVVGGLQSITDWLNSGGMHQVAGVVGVVAVSAVLRLGVSVASTIPLVRASAASLLDNAKAAITDATSQQALDAAILKMQRNRVIATLAIRNYKLAIIEATTATVAYVRALPAKIAQLHSSTTAMLTNARATLTMTNAQKLATSTAILTGRGMVGVGTALSNVGGVIKAHPFMLLATVMSAIVVKTEGLKGAITSLGRTLGVIGVMFEDFIGTTVDGWGMIFDVASGVLGGILGQSKSTTGGVTGYFGEMFKGTEGGFIGLLQVGAKIFDDLATRAITFSKMTVQNITNAWIHIKNGFKQVGNSIVAVFEGVANKGVDFANSIIDKINAIIDGLNTISSFTGFTVARVRHVGRVSLGRLSVEDVPIANGYQAQYEQNKVTVATDYINGAIQRSKEQTQANNEVAKSLNNVSQAYAGVENKAEEAGDKAEKSAKKAEKSIRGVNDALKLAENMTNQFIEWDKQWFLIQRYPNGLLGTQTAQFDYEANNIHGKFFGLDQSVKDLMADTARTMDELSAGAELLDKRIDIAKRLSAIKNGDNQYQDLKYELYNDANSLSFAAENIKKEALGQMAILEASMALQEINDKANDVKKELEQVDYDGFIKEVFVIEQQKIDILEKYNYLLRDGYNQEFALIEEQANDLAMAQTKLVVAKEYHDLISSLKTEEEKRLSVLQNQLHILNNQNVLTGSMIDIDKAKQLINQNVGLTTPTDKYKELNDKTTNQYASLDAGLQTLLDNERLTEQERIGIKAWGADERLKIERAHTQAMNALVLSDSQNMFGSLASIAKDGLGEQSKLYRAMFAVQQGFAIAQAGIAMQQAISQGLSKGFPTGLADMALAAAEGAKIISAIKSVVVPVGQAHDGIMSVPKSGTWNLEKGERVLPKHTAKALDDKLAKIGTGHGETKIIINNYSGEKTEIQQMPNGDTMVIIGKMIDAKVDAKINQRFIQARRQGGELYGR